MDRLSREVRKPLSVPFRLLARSWKQRDGRQQLVAYKKRCTTFSRRPDADYAGGISHALAALEAVAKDVTGQENLTLGQVIAQGRLNELLPSENIRQSVMSAWRYANDEGARHGREGREPERTEGEFIVGLAATVATYLNKKALGTITTYL